MKGEGEVVFEDRGVLGVCFNCLVSEMCKLEHKLASLFSRILDLQIPGLKYH